MAELPSNLVYAEDWIEGEPVEIITNEPQPPQEQYYLEMDGVNDSLILPTMAMDRIVLDVNISSAMAKYRYIVDARVGSAYYYRLSDRDLPQSFGFTASGFILNERTTLVLTAPAPFTDDVRIFARSEGAQPAQGVLYSVTCYLNGQVIALYDMTQGNVLDQSGNERHATLNGGTWVQVESG